MIELSKIRIDGGTQPRAELSQETVAEYADAYKANASTMPPVTLFFDGANYWLADGFHRYFGAKAAGKDQIAEDITPGTLRDAILFSLSANSRHGLKRSNADKRKAVKTLLDDAEWSKWSSNEIAKRCAVSHFLVDEVRKSYLAEMQDSSPDTRTVQRNGTTYEQDVSRIGKPVRDAMPEPAPASRLAPISKPKLLTEEESALILAENARLQEVAETLAKDAGEAIADNESMAKIFEADDQLAAALQENEKLRAEVRVLRERLNGKMGECAQLNRLLTKANRRLALLEGKAAA